MKLPHLISIFATVVTLIVASTTWQFYLEKHARQSARNTLQKVSSCVSEYPEGDIINKLEFCASGVTTTPTGDIFAFDMQSGKFLFDPSLDCRVEGGAMMTEESICSIHADPRKCATALRHMMLGVNSYPSLRASWLFDDATEYLEWIVYPGEHMNLDGSSVNNKNPTNQVIIAIGIQSDELFEDFVVYDFILKAMALFMLLVTLLQAVYQRGKDGRSNA